MKRVVLVWVLVGLFAGLTGGCQQKCRGRWAVIPEEKAPATAPDREREAVEERPAPELEQAPLTLADVPEGEDPEGVITVSDEDFEAVVERFDLMLIDCWAPWCGPCRKVAPVVEALARDHAGRLVCGQLNIDENPTTAREYRIKSIPTLLLFQNGERVDRRVGAQPRAQLESWLVKYLPAP